MTPAPDGTDPFRALQRRMDRLFDDIADDCHWPFADGWGATMPTIDVSETDNELTVDAELSGVDEKDIDVTLTVNLLTIKGEKRTGKRRQEERLSPDRAQLWKLQPLDDTAFRR